MSLPKWRSQDQRDVREMTRWVNDELNRMDVAALRKDIKGESDYVGWAIEQADKRASIEPLRNAFPNLARFLQFPKKRVGERGERKGFDPIKGAALDVMRIQDLWKATYGNKRRTTAPSATEIAAERWDVPVSMVANKMKKMAEKKKTSSRQ